MTLGSLHTPRGTVTPRAAEFEGEQQESVQEDQPSVPLFLRMPVLDPLPCRHLPSLCRSFADEYLHRRRGHFTDQGAHPEGFLMCGACHGARRLGKDLVCPICDARGLDVSKLEPLIHDQNGVKLPIQKQLKRYRYKAGTKLEDDRAEPVPATPLEKPKEVEKPPERPGTRPGTAAGSADRPPSSPSTDHKSNVSAGNPWGQLRGMNAAGAATRKFRKGSEPPKPLGTKTPKSEAGGTGKFKKTAVLKAAVKTGGVKQPKSDALGQSTRPKSDALGQSTRPKSDALGQSRRDTRRDTGAEQKTPRRDTSAKPKGAPKLDAGPRAERRKSTRTTKKKK
eukprot:Hpha_TRINITY_DN15293_c1_g8::TRINITY_DN15293_c1_g8_i1::g.67565::m.67565